MRRPSWVLCQALCLDVFAAEALAQAPFPGKPIKIVVPYAPGGLSDVVARLYAEQLRQRDVEDAGIVVEERA